MAVIGAAAAVSTRRMTAKWARAEVIAVDVAAELRRLLKAGADAVVNPRDGDVVVHARATHAPRPRGHRRTSAPSCQRWRPASRRWPGVVGGDAQRRLAAVRGAGARHVAEQAILGSRYATRVEVLEVVHRARRGAAAGDARPPLPEAEAVHDGRARPGSPGGPGAGLARGRSAAVLFGDHSPPDAESEHVVGLRLPSRMSPVWRSRLGY